MSRFAVLILLMCLSAVPVFAQDRTVPQDREGIHLSYAPLVKKVAPAVVNIYAQRTVTRRVSPFAADPFFEQFFGGAFGGGMTRQRVENALGSGVIVQPDGLVVTNAHVVSGADEVKVVLADGREFAAEITLVDEPSDLALIRIEKDGVELPHASLQPSDALEVGDLVLAIGNPFGVGQTVTSGIVSALARSTLDINDINFFIQTDAAINPGNSGGALVSMDGGVVGINSAIYSRSGGSLGIGFAIPSEMVAAVIAAEESGAGAHGIIRPWLGVTVQSVTAEIAESMGLEKPGGALIAKLHKASPMKKAGLGAGDIVLAVDGKPVRDPAEMRFRMAMVPIGSEMTISALKKGKSKEFQVTTMAPPEDPPRNETRLTGQHPLYDVVVGNINPAVSTELGIDEEDGVVVLSTKSVSRARIRIVRPGDIIVSVNGRKIKTVEDLQDILERGSVRGWELIISRDGHESQLYVR